MDEIAKELKLLNRQLQRLLEHICPQLSEELLDRAVAFRAFSYNGSLVLRVVERPDPVVLEELKGIDGIIERLRRNTEQFLASLPCNNVLLYGPRGVGKSSVIKALLNEYHKNGLRMIEMDRDALLHLPEIKDLIRDRGEKYIVFCDDLSFDVDDSSYRQLKAVLEGSLEARPDNMLIYATSNRRHLMPERVDEDLHELHPAESVEEKISLSDRFGLRLGFVNFDQETFLMIVDNYVKLRGIMIEPAELHRRAIQWALSHGSFSGRTARQFVDDLEGTIGLERL